MKYILQLSDVGSHGLNVLGSCRSNVVSYRVQLAPCWCHRTSLFHFFHNRQWHNVDACGMIILRVMHLFGNLKHNNQKQSCQFLLGYILYNSTANAMENHQSYSPLNGMVTSVPKVIHPNWIQHCADFASFCIIFPCFSSTVFRAQRVPGRTKPDFGGRDSTAVDRHQTARGVSMGWDGRPPNYGGGIPRIGSIAERCWKAPLFSMTSRIRLSFRNCEQPEGAVFFDIYHTCQPNM